MIIQERKDVSSNIINNTVGIDVSNIGFISQLLTSNLYEKPLESFLRETVANAIDATKESGNDTPVLIYINCENNMNTKIFIRDYGTGLSPERFDKIYKNIGSSTKRDSNDYIGAFGIGRFSCLSLSDECYITSYFNNKKYEYIIYKGNGQVNIDLINTSDTEEPNGLMVSVEKEWITLDNLKSALEKLFLLNIHIVLNIEKNSYVGKSDTERLISSINEKKSIEYKNFYSIPNTVTKVSGVEMGGIIYPCKYRDIPKGCIIKVPMGSLLLTPSREGIQDNNKNQEIIDKHIKLAIEEMTIILSRQKTVEDVSKFMYEIVTNELKIDENLSFYNFGNLSKRNIEFPIYIKDLNITPPKEVVNFLRVNNSSKNESSIYYSSIGKKFTLGYLIRSRVSLFYKENNKIKKAILEWYKQNYDKIVILSQDNIDDIIIAFNTTKEIIYYILKDLCKIQKIDYTKSISLEKENKEETIITIKRADCGAVYIEKYATIKGLIESVKSNNGRIKIICPYNSELGIILSKLSLFSNIDKIYLIPSKAYSLIKSNKNILKEEDILSVKNRYIAKILQAIIILRSPIRYMTYSNILSEFKEEYKNIETKLSCVSSGYFDSLDFLIELYKNNNWLNMSEIKYYNVTKEELEKYRKYIDFKNDTKLIERLVKIYTIRKIGTNPKILTF